MAHVPDHLRSATLALTSTSVFSTLTRILDVARQRRSLARLDTAQLADLGLSRRDALEEAARPVWDVHHTWTV